MVMRPFERDALAGGPAGEVPQPAAEEPAREEAVAEAEAGADAPARRKHRLRGYLGWALYLAIIIGAILLGPRILGAVLQTDHPLATISSGSMWPALKVGDIVLLQGADNIEDLNVGDIVAFRHKGGLAIHRIVRIEDEQITTRGDANGREDAPIVFDDVIGRAVKVGGRLARIPYLGNLAELLGPVVGTTTEDPPGQPAQSSSEGAGTAATGP